MQSEVQGAEATVDYHLRNLIQLMKRGGRISVTDIPNYPTFLSSHFGGPTAQAMAEKLEAALSAVEPQPAPSVAVKELEWSPRNDQPQYEVCADTPFGRYKTSNKGEYGFGWMQPRQTVWSGFLPTLEEAKAAAQADYEARIRSALSAQVQDVAGWQPIETAPKDGTPILGYYYGKVLTAHWGADGSESRGGKPAWIDGSFDKYEEFFVYPLTHWMPLPSAPAATNEEG